LSPVVSIVFSVVVVVVPSGVEVVVSVLVEASFEQPVKPSDAIPVNTTSESIHFISLAFRGECERAMCPNKSTTVSPRGAAMECCN